MGVTIIQVDAFTDKPFAGNPAAVCVLAEPAADVWMQDVAREMNLSETAFLDRREDGYNLRWFTPSVEVDLCGHATLASAHVLWEQGHLMPDEVARFHTRSGLLTATLDREWIVLDFPVDSPQPAQAPENLLAALGVTAKAVNKSPYFYLIELESEEAVRMVAPDFGELAKIDAMGTMGTIITSRAESSSYDFVSRFFGPAVGIDEDPVTGASHTCLTPYWSAKLGKQKLRAYQASARGGSLRLEMSGDRVHIGGQAVTVMRGELV